MNTVAAKDSKQQLMQAFEQILAEKRKLDTKIATKQEEAEKEKDKELKQNQRGGRQQAYAEKKNKNFSKTSTFLV